MSNAYVIRRHKLEILCMYGSVPVTYEKPIPNVYNVPNVLAEFHIHRHTLALYVVV